MTAVDIVFVKLYEPETVWKQWTYQIVEAQRTYVYSEDLRDAVRARFPDIATGQHDDQYDGKPGAHNIMVTWADLKPARWPGPPKSCLRCKKRGSPY